MEDLEEATRCHREALNLRPHGHPDRSSSLNNLANALSTRFEQLGGMKDSDEAIGCHREALLMAPMAHPLSITSQTPYLLALGSQGARMICGMHSSIFLKQSPYYRLSTRAMLQSDPISLLASHVV